jgi:hypothetical protein
LRPVELFRANELMRDGLHSWCRDCTRAAVRRWREANREYVDAYNAARRIGAPAPQSCVVCGETFQASRRDAKTCSKKCRGRLAYLRRKGEA